MIITMPAKNLLLCTLVFGFTTSLLAADTNDLNEAEASILPIEGKEKQFEFNIGIGVLHGPKYEDHSDEDTKLFPLVGIEYGHWSLGMNGIQYQVLESSIANMHAGISYDEGRDASDDLPKSQRGLGDIDGGADFNLKIEIKLFDLLSLNINTSKSLDHHSHYKSSMSAASMFPIYKKHLIGKLSIKSTWHDSEHNQLFYGVTKEQSAKTGLTSFKAHSGFHDISYSITSILSLTESLNTSLSITFQTLQSDAARSPITERKDIILMIQTLSYKF